MYAYRISGLEVASDLPLPGATPAGDLGALPQVVIRRGIVPHDLVGDDVQRSPTWQIRGDQVLLHIRGIAQFELTGGREIRYALDAEATPDDLAIFLIGTVFGILLHQRGQLVLHASAVRVGDHAVLFCGASGAGKSTMAAALNRHGYPLLTDDVCALDIPEKGAPLVQPDGRLLKLWAHAIDQLSLRERQGQPVRAVLDKHFVAPCQVSCDALPIGAVHVLVEANPTLAPGIEPVTLIESATLLRRNAYRPSLIRRMGQEGSYFSGLARVAQAAPVSRLIRRIDFAELDGVVSGLERYWSALGLLAAEQ